MRFGWCIFPIFALAGCASQPVIAPNGVVSNNPCIDAVLAEIALPGQVTAISSYSHDPDSASAPLAWSAKLPAIGTGAEELLLARPKLVLTGNLAASGANAVLARAGVKTVAIGVAPTLAEDIQQIRTIAAALGRVDADLAKWRICGRKGHVAGRIIGAPRVSQCQRAIWPVRMERAAVGDLSAQPATGHFHANSRARRRCPCTGCAAETAPPFGQSHPNCGLSGQFVILRRTNNHESVRNID
ncbi:MAG: hypothetical protein NTU75_08510 [Sphingomonadales bacterium]|nr:hypothetical protein [Sphingomonadales bacterium]